MRNIRRYLLAALFNAPSTMDCYYTALVNHDLYGSGSRGSPNSTTRRMTMAIQWPQIQYRRWDMPNL